MAADDETDAAGLFNYYERNYLGPLVLENIESAPTQGMALFQYEARYTNGNLSRVTGYYHDSKRIKFVDTIENGRVARTQYSAPDGSVIQDKRLVWEGARLRRIESSQTTMNGNTTTVLQEFTYSGPLSIGYSAEKTYTSKNEIRSLVSTGTFTTEMRPLHIHSVLSVSFADDDFEVDEYYTYAAEGLLTDYRVVSSAYGEIQHFQYEYENGKLVRKTGVTDMGRVRRETYYQDGHEVEYNNLAGNEMRKYSDKQCMHIRQKLTFCKWESSRGDGLVDRALEAQDERIQQVATGQDSYSTSKTLILDATFVPTMDAFPHRYVERYYESRD